MEEEVGVDRMGIFDIPLPFVSSIFTSNRIIFVYDRKNVYIIFIFFLLCFLRAVLVLQLIMLKSDAE